MSKKYPRTYHLPYSPGTTSDDRIAKTTISLLNREIIITEKIDGGNICMTNKGLYERSHADFSVSPWTVKVRKMQDLIKYDLDNNIELFGEGVEAIHSIEYENLESYFYLFGARENENRWYSWKEVEETAFLLDLKTVPVLFKGILNTPKELQDLVESFVVKGESRLGGKIEGCVVRISESFEDSKFSESVMKWVRKGHVSTGQHWTRNWKKAKLINR